MNPLLAAGDPFQHTWDTWLIELPWGKLDLRHYGNLEALGVTKFVLMMASASVLLIVMGMLAGAEARRATREGRCARGLGALVEVLVQFVRDEMMRPAMPHHYTKPLLVALMCTFFFFILFCNLLGLAPMPFGSTATGTIFVTGALALITFAAIVLAGFYEHGVGGFIAHLAPPAPWWVRWPLLLPIEAVGLLVKPVALMLRLAANMTAGHIILAVLLGFLLTEGSAIKWGAVYPASAFGFFAITVFEIAIAFIQAYIFTNLSCVFIGASLSHEH